MVHAATAKSPFARKPLLGYPRIIFALVILLVVVVLAIAAPFVRPFHPEELDLSLRLAAPDAAHIFGCDINGRDVLTSMLHGARISLYIALITVALSATLGTIIGLICGFYLGLIDTVLMRFVDILLAIPGILLALVLTSLLGPSVNNVIFAIAATGWTSSARLIRGQVLSLREREFVTASRALGARDFHLIFRHIFPLTLAPLMVHATFSLSAVIIVEASLSFLGLGPQDGPPTWGALLGQGRAALTEAPHLSLVPGIAIMLVILALNFLGDGLRDYFDPKSR